MAWFKIRKFIRFYLLAFLTTVFLLSLTIIIYWKTQESAAERNQNLFELRTEVAKTAIEKRMVDYIQILKGAQGLFKVSDNVTLSEWKAYIASLQVNENYPGILGIGYTSFFSQAKLSAFESHMKRLGHPAFRVWPEGERPYYSSIIYLEPFHKRNQQAFGYDMFTDSIRRKAMERALVTGQPALSAMVTLVQEITSQVQKGFLLYLPVYHHEAEPGSVAERRSSITGFVYSPFRVNDLMRAVLGTRFADLDIEIYDGDPGNQTLLFDKDSIYSYNNNSDSNLQKISQVQIAGHMWQLRFTAIPGDRYDFTFPYFVLGGGLLVSVLIFIIMFSLAKIERSNYMNQLITDHASAALFILDMYDRCTFMNPAAIALTGYTLQEMQQDTLHHMVHHSHPDGSSFPASHCTIVRSLNNKEALHNYDSYFIRKNGQRVQVRINTQPIQENGKVAAHLVEARDITKKKEIEIALRKKNKILQTLNSVGKNLSAELELNKVLQAVTDACTELTGAAFGAFFYNKAAEEGTSLTLHNLSGIDAASFSRLSMPKHADVFSVTLHRESILRSDDITKDPRYHKHKVMVQESLPVKSYLAVPVISRGGTVLGCLIFGHPRAGIFDETTEEIVKGVAAQAAIAIDNSLLFEAISAKNDQLTRINNDLDNFVYTASHDLKAPVLNIEGLVNALTAALRDQRPEKRDKIIDMIKISISKFKETIEALTEVSRTNRQLDEEVELIHLPNLLDDIKLSINDIMEASGAQIQANLACPDLKFSKANLKSILLNLITNAIKYKSPVRSPVICIHCKKEAGKIILSVSDNGLGIPANFLPKMFMMFKRYHAHVEGTGIGLYLVKRIVENYNGSLEVYSEVDKGTTFTITLPDL